VVDDVLADEVDLLDFGSARYFAKRPALLSSRFLSDAR
jgi:hypothetical protein